ncbi:MAG: 4-hydroxy-3-methylbut-2-enyl diphosphate reductase [Mycobacterium sp.]
MKSAVVYLPMRHKPAGQYGPVLLAEVMDSLTSEPHTGDLIVADELHQQGTVSVSRAAPLVAGALRRLGLRTHVGALGIDTGWAFVNTPEFVEQIVALRVTADNPIAADTILRAATPAINQWAAAVEDREILLASPRSFCAGVDRAIEIVERALQRFGSPLYVRRQIVHNHSVVHDLEALGAVFVNEIGDVPEGSTVVLAAHGVAPSVRRDADARGLRVIDATCPLVAKVHAEVRRFAAKGRTVFLIGHGEHEEVEGTRGEAPENVVVVANPAEAETVHPADPRKVAYVMQTTLAADEAERTVAVLRERFPALVAPLQEDICYATTNRQAAVRDVAARCDLVLVLGSDNSSNSHRLAEVAERCGTTAYLVENASDVDLRWLVGARRVGVTAGASAPPHLVDEVVRTLSGLGRITVREAVVADEDVEFTLPLEVR